MITLLTAAVAAPLVIDAGPWGGPVWDGAVALTPAGSADRRVTWSTPPDDAGGGDWPDPLAGDWVRGGVVHVALPAGRYEVAVMVGRDGLSGGERTAAWGIEADHLRLIDQPAATTWEALRPTWLDVPDPVFRPGETVWDRGPAVVHRWHRATVKVDADGLSLRTWGRPLQAVAIWPLGDPAPDLVAGRRAWFLAHHLPEPDPVPPVDLPVAGTLTDVHGAAWPTTATLADGDRVSLVWWPGEQARSVQIEAPAGLDAELYELRWEDVRDALGQLRVRPTWLRPTPGDLRGGQGLPPAVLVRLRADRPFLGGNLTLRSGDRSATVALTALPVALPASPVPTGYAMQVHPTATRLDGFDAPSVRALLDADLARQADLGFSAVALRGALGSSPFPADPEAALSLTRHAFEVWQDLGGRSLVWADPKVYVRPSAFLAPTDEPVPAALREPMRALLQAAANAPFPVQVSFWEEEGGWKNADASTLAERLLGTLRPLAPAGATLSATTGHPIDWEAGALYDAIFVTCGPPMPADLVARYRARGVQVHAYNLSPGTSGPLAGWAMGADSLLEWHWNPSAGDGMDGRGRAGLTAQAVHAPDGQVWHTLTAERFAEGVALTRWIAAIEAALLASPHHPAAAEARALLDALRQTLAAANPVAAWENEVLAPSALPGLRPTLATHLRALTSSPPRSKGRR